MKKIVPFLVIGVVAGVLGGLFLTEGIGSRSSGDEVSVHVNVAGLREGDALHISGGRESSVTIQDSFELTVEKNGLTKLPVDETGTWEVSASAVDYGEVPETYKIKVDEGDNIVVEFKLAKSLPLIEETNWEQGAELSFFGTIWSMENVPTAWMYGTHVFGVLEGDRKMISFVLESDNIDLNAYERRNSTWVQGILVHNGLDGGPPLLKVTDIQKAGEPTREID